MKINTQISDRIKDSLINKFEGLMPDRIFNETIQMVAKVKRCDMDMDINTLIKAMTSELTNVYLSRFSKSSIKLNQIILNVQDISNFANVTNCYNIIVSNDISNELSNLQEFEPCENKGFKIGRLVNGCTINIFLDAKEESPKSMIFLNSFEVPKNIDLRQEPEERQNVIILSYQDVKTVSFKADCSKFNQ